ncbi:hypothetical protein [Spirosoma pomorum]|jgi:hypothetical protein
MAQHQEELAALQEIRSLMQRSSRFTSLSGLSGILAGLLALISVGIVYGYLHQKDVTYADVCRGNLPAETGTFLVVVALITLVLALGSVIVLTYVKAQKAQESIWHLQGQRLFSNLSIPLLAGGVFCLILVYHQIVYLVVPAMLVFYGLAMLNSSKYTFAEIRYLGIGEIILGLLVGFWVDYGLLAWGAGFGILNILYGTLLYFRYEKR